MASSRLKTKQEESKAETNLKASGTPVNKLDGSLRLDGGNGGVDVLGHDISAIQQTAGHVLAVARIAFHLRTRKAGKKAPR